MTKIGGDGKSQKGGRSGDDMIPLSSPLYLHPSYSPSLKLTHKIFNGENYDLWADAVRNGLDVKNKLGFVEGTVKKPEGTEADNYEVMAWRQCNAMIKAWLRAVIDDKLLPSIAFSGTVYEIWKELKDRYAAATYCRVPTCTCGAATEFFKEKEEEKVHQFIMGLNTALYDNLRSNLLMDDDLTSLNRVYGLVLREERHKAVTRVREEPTVEVAMSARTGGGRGIDASAAQTEHKDYEPPRCTHCKKWYHTVDNCRERLGLSGRGRGMGRRGGRGGGRGGREPGSNKEVVNAATTSEGESSKKDFTNEEIKQLRNLLSI
ncbi:uncharacterized protein LOC141594876 [Silene latifolia]|uniref:uncharacterized protein LOC141594876 n=1 Tax=Silene latifolia TaxID=37657 RepID=UPI003D773F75